MDAPAADDIGCLPNSQSLFFHNTGQIFLLSDLLLSSPCLKNKEAYLNDHDKLVKKDRRLLNV